MDEARVKYHTTSSQEATVYRHGRLARVYVEDLIKDRMSMGRHYRDNAGHVFGT